MKRFALTLAILAASLSLAFAQGSSFSVAASTAYATSKVIKASPGMLYSLTVYNSKASAQFIQLYDAASLPADTAVPVLTLTVAASSNITVPLPANGMPFATGIVAGNSSTGPTKTVGSADCYFTAVYR